MAELLRAEGVRKHYGGVHALRGADFAVRAGEVHALMGENGAGKSTLARIIAGAGRPDGGRILLDGAEVKLASPLDAQRRGIGIIYQELDLFPHLTVAENLAIGNLRAESSALVDFARLDAFARRCLDQVGLDVAPGAPLGELPIARRQLVAIARALAMEARLILMDEPTSSLGAEAAEKLFAVIGELRRRGVAVVYVSHKMDEIFRLADRLTVLRDGETVGTRQVSATSAGEVVRMMVGRDLRERTRARPAAGEVALEVRDLATARLRGVSFQVRRGEVLGVAGLVGAGRSELGAALFGLDPVVAGEMELAGRPYRPRSPRQAIAAGVGLLPEDRTLDGLMPRMTAQENSSLTVLGRRNRLPHLQTAGWVRRAAERAAVQGVHRGLAVKAALDAEAATLSGGNQQKVLLSRWLLADPAVLFLDDPTRGIDVGAKRDIYDMIDGLAGGGKAVIFVSSELPELLACADRILVLAGGRVTATLDAAAATEEQILRAALGATLDP